MTKTKSTKRALLMSALSLLMCVSMLIGSTFAWFTDSVTSSGNKIKAGNLDVDLFLWTADGQSEITNETAPIFGGANSIAATANNADTLWEPGKTQVVYLSIKNNGSLDLKYKVALDVKDADADQNLYEVMKYAITNDAKYGAVDAWDSAKGVSVVPGVNETQANDVALKAGEEHFFALSVHMDEAAGNQYQGGEVDFDIRVLATQVASESDSFNNQYDKDAVYGDVMVSSDAELKAAIEDPAMKVIAVNGDLTYDWGSESYENSKALNMKGKTFLGANDVASITFAGYGSANPIVNATFKDITIKDITKGDNESSWEHGYLEFKNLTAVNVTFANSIMMEGDFATFKNCSFNSNKDGEYAVWVANGDATFEGCTFTGYRGIKVHEDYGSEVKTVVVDNCSFKNITKKPGMAIGTLNADTTVAIKDSKFVGCQAGDQSLYIYETDTDVTTFNFIESGNELFGLATDNTALKTALSSAQAGDTVYVADGEYTLPKLNKGVTIIGSENTVVTNTLSGTLNDVTLKNIKIKAGDAQRWAYGKGKVVFENCTFEATSVYAIHYDGLSGANITYKDCTIIGWAALGSGAEHITFDGCKIYGNGAYGLIRVYSPATIKNCTFDVSAVNTTDIYQDGIHAVDCEIKVSNNINVNGAIEYLYNVSGTGKIVAE